MASLGYEAEEIPAYKEKCAKCKYHGVLGGAKSGGELRYNYIFCNYICIERERRNCPPEHCDKFTAGKRIELNKGITII